MMYPEGRLWGFKPAVEFSFCFSIMYAQKYCPSSAPVFMKFKIFIAEKRKNLYCIFTFCFSLLALPLDPTWGLLPSDALAWLHPF